MEKVIKESVIWAVKLTNEVVKSLEDKKVTFWEGLGFTDNAIDAGRILSFYHLFPNDWALLSKDESYTDEVIKAVESLDINHDKAKRLTLQIVKAGIEIGKVVSIALEK